MTRSGAVRLTRRCQSNTVRYRSLAGMTAAGGSLASEPLARGSRPTRASLRVRVAVLESASRAGSTARMSGTATSMHAVTASDTGPRRVEEAGIL
jgi:hypothetical protein